MIRIENVHKRYTTRRGVGDWVLRGVNMVIPTGRSVGLVGVNGAGKSTLLRIIGGADYPTRGRVRRYCRVSWPMANGGLEGTLTGRQNAKFVCRIHGFQNELPERIARIEEFAELGKAFDEPIQTYSSGMRSRLAFSIACLVNPDVIILDEVLSVGDGAFRKKSGSKMQEILSSGVTGILVSHSVSQVREMCNKILWLDHGRQIAFGEDVTTLCNAYEEFLITKKVPETHEQILEASEAWNARQEVIRRQKKENYAERLEQLVAECGAGTAVQAAVDILYRNRAELLNRELCLGEELIPEK